MEIMGDLDNFVIKVPRLRPFRGGDAVVCPACGFSVSGKWRRFLRFLAGKKTEEIARVRYCPGDRPPSEKVEGFSYLVWGQSEVVHGCAGIPVPHLHLTCIKCSAVWYAELKEPA